MSTFMNENERTRRTQYNHQSNHDKPEGVLELALSPGQSVVVHEPNDPLNKAVITVAKVTSGKVYLQFEAPDKEVWRSGIYSKRLSDWVKDRLR